MEEAQVTVVVMVVEAVMKMVVEASPPARVCAREVMVVILLACEFQ
jgi:hypothetical protein